MLGSPFSGITLLTMREMARHVEGVPTPHAIGQATTTPISTSTADTTLDTATGRAITTAHAAGKYSSSIAGKRLQRHPLDLKLFPSLALNRKILDGLRRRLQSKSSDTVTALLRIFRPEPEPFDPQEGGSRWPPEPLDPPPEPFDPQEGGSRWPK